MLVNFLSTVTQGEQTFGYNLTQESNLYKTVRFFFCMNSEKILWENVGNYINGNEVCPLYFTAMRAWLYDHFQHKLYFYMGCVTLILQ